MPHLSRNDIEAIARRIIRAYNRLPGIEKTERRIHPKMLVTDLLGLSIEHYSLSVEGRILGLTACGEIEVPVFDDPENPQYVHLDGKTVLIDKNLISEGANVGRYHFTLIHEACHQIFKMLFPRDYLPEIACRCVHYCSPFHNKGADYWEEWRTNALTSAVLMPEEMVRLNMVSFGLGHRLRMLNWVFVAEEYQRFSDMAEYMGVSKRALAIRLKQLELLEGDHLQDPYVLDGVVNK